MDKKKRAEELRQLITEDDTAIRRLQDRRAANRIELVGLVSPFKMGEIMVTPPNRLGNIKRAIITHIVPGNSLDSHKLQGTNIKKDGTPGQKTVRFYSWENWTRESDGERYGG